LEENQDIDFNMEHGVLEYTTFKCIFNPFLGNNENFWFLIFGAKSETKAQKIKIFDVALQYLYNHNFYWVLAFNMMTALANFVCVWLLLMVDRKNKVFEVVLFVQHIFIICIEGI
jgi:hypothetical protein